MQSVLIVQEDRRRREAIVFNLRAAGHHVSAVGNLVAAVEASAHVDPFVILVEPNLLQGTGESFSAAVEKRTGRLIPLIALAARTEKIWAAVIARNGASALPRSPHEFDAIEEVLRELAPASSAPSGGATDEFAPGVLPPTSGAKGGKLMPAAVTMDGSVLAWEYVTKNTGPLVLAVDDSATSRMLLCVMLAEGNFRPHTADTAINALRYLKSNPDVDVIISDLFMPGMNGLQFKDSVDRWRGSPLPFVLVTAAATEEAEQVAKALGAATVLRKPIPSAGELHAAIFKALHNA